MASNTTHTQAPPAAQSGPSPSRRAWDLITVALTVLQGVLAIATMVAFVTHAASQRLIGYGLCGIAGLGMLGPLAPWRLRWAHEATSIGLALTVAVVGLVVVLHNPLPSTVNIVEPIRGTSEARCSIEVRFTGEPPRGQAFVVATVQGTSAYYFEGGVRRDPTSREWRARVQVGSRNRGLGEEYD